MTRRRTLERRIAAVERAIARSEVKLAELLASHRDELEAEFAAEVAAGLASPADAEHARNVLLKIVGDAKPETEK